MRNCRVVMLAAVVVSSIFATKEAKAFTVFPSPFGSAPVRIVIGNISGTSPGVCFTRISDGAWFIRQFPQSFSALADNIEVSGSSGSDEISVVSSSTTACGTQTFSALNYGGFFLDISGLDGHDVLHAMTAGDTWIYAGGGDDIATSFGPTSRITGGPGADRLFNFSSGTSNELFGEDGIDCLFDTNQAASVVDCGGPGFSDQTNVPVQVNCEIAVSTC